MAKIEFVSLGGQDEKDKLCSALIIDGDIYVLGCGIHCPSAVTLGIKKIIADYSFLIDNKDRIRGIFIPTPSYNAFGGLEFLTKQLPNVPIFTSNLGQVIINNNLEWAAGRFRNNQNQNFKPKTSVIAVEPLKPFRCGRAEILGFRTASYMPTSLGFVFKADGQSIVFVDQFMIPTSANNAMHDLIDEVKRYTNGYVVLLIVAIGKNINNAGFTSPKYSVSSFYENVLLDMTHRGIFCLEEEDVYKLINLANLANAKSIPFYIYSGSLAKAFSYMQQARIVSFPNLIYINEAQINTIDRGIIVVSGDRQSLFTKLQKIVMGDDHRLEFKPTDTFVYSMLTVNGFEKLEANLFDSLNRLNIAKIVKLPKDIIQLSQSQEDHKLLINILKPKFVIPVNGLYMDFVKYRNFNKGVATNPKNILITSNGQFIEFDGDKLVNTKKHIKVVEQYVGSAGLYDVGASGLFECEQMADSGCVLASLMVDKNNKTVKHFNYNIVGVINQADEKNQAIVNEINAHLNSVMVEELKKLKPGMNLTRDQQDYFKKQIVKQYEKKFGKRPLVLLTIIYTDNVNKAIDTIVDAE